MKSNARITYRLECWRAVSSGILETAGITFLMLIAVRWFAAGVWAKALVAGGGSLGLILSPWLVSRVEHSGLPVARAAARMALVGAGSFLVMALWPAKPVFVMGSVLAMACSAAILPLMTQIFHDNYPAAERGARFSRTVSIRIASAAGFGALAGWVLSSDGHFNLLGHGFASGIGLFRWLLAVFAAALALAAFCLSRIPSRPLTASGGTHPFRALRHLREDRPFRQTLIAWMFLGFGNLMMVPLRVEYLANPKYAVTLAGAALSAGSIAFFTGVLPNLARLLLNPLWGGLFDRMNFFTLRIALNISFVIGILAFFVSHSTAGLAAGAVFYGIAMAGGDVAWNLWVTKFAPPARVADYMAVHTFFTGLRGVVAPVMAFLLAAHLPLEVIGWMSAALILVGTALLIPEVRLTRRAPAPLAANCMKA